MLSVVLGEELGGAPSLFRVCTASVLARCKTHAGHDFRFSLCFIKVKLFFIFLLASKNRY